MIIADTDFGEQPNVNLRRLRRWRKSVMRCQKDQRYLVEPAITPQDFAESMRLVHDSFVESGYVRPYEYGLRLREYEITPGFTTFVVRDTNNRNEIVGTASIVWDGPIGFPSEQTFRGEILNVKTIQNAKSVAEWMNWAVCPHHRHSLHVNYELAHFCLGWLEVTGCDSLFGSVSPNAQHFFEELLLNDIIGSKNCATSVIEDPVICIWVNPQQLRTKAESIDKLLGKDAFLMDFLFHTSPVYEYVKHHDIKQVETAFQCILTKAAAAHLASVLDARE